MQKVLTALLFLASPLAAEDLTTKLTFNSLQIQEEQEYWESFSYSSHDRVQSFNNISARAFEESHRLFKMDQRSPLARGFYLLTAGQIHARVVWANSLMAHEHAHFQYGHLRGLDTHYFRDDETGERFDDGEAWTRIFLYGDAGGPAISAGTSHDDGPLWVEKAAAGLNWQTEHSARLAREWARQDSVKMSESIAYMANKVYPFSYTAGEAAGIHKNDPNTDPGRIFEHLELTQGVENVETKAVATLFASLLLSPTVAIASNATTAYVKNGDLSVKPKRRNFKYGTMVLDTPAYFNADNISLMPTVHTQFNDGVWGEIDNVQFSFGIEQGVVGQPTTEVYVGGYGEWKNLDVDLGYTIGQHGSLMEIEMGTKIGRDLKLSYGLAQTNGHTMRGARNLAGTEKLSWMNLTAEF